MNINELHDLCETVSDAIVEANRKIESSGGKLSGSDVDYIDKLTHSLKSIKAVMSMMEEEDGYSERGRMSRRSYRGSYDGGSYRRSYRRDSMGRYSRDEDYEQSLREAMENAPDEQTRQSLARMMDSMR